MERSAQFGFLTFLLGMTVFYARSTAACSVARINSPDELVHKADAIYVVQAKEYIANPLKGSHGHLDSRTIRFVVLETLKGDGLRDLQAAGSFSDVDDPNDGPVPYMFVRPEGRRGNCYAATYRLDSAYLFFVRGGTPYWSPLAPVNEQVSLQGDDWVIWVKRRLSDGHDP
jgi:hypothetical protein